MKIYSSDWLTNASIVGYLRIQNKCGIKPKVQDNYVEIKEQDIEHFADAYFVVVLEQYMQNSFVISKQHKNQLEPKKVEEQAQFKSKIDAFSDKQKLGKFDYTSYQKTVENQLASLKQYKVDIKKFLADIQKEFEIKSNTIDSVLNANNKKIDSKIDAISGASQKFLPNALQRFYFNKVVIGNYSISKKTSRYDEFNKKFVRPAIATLKDDSNDGHITCKICKQKKVHIKSFDENLLSETTFSSIMVSHKTFSNFFYNYQSDMFICSICDMLLLCSWAGFNPIPNIVSDDISKTDNVFLNLPNISMSLKYNNLIKDNDERNSYRFKETIYSKTIPKILVDRQRKKSSWILENMFFVEIKTVSRKDSGKPDFRYYHIGKNIACLFDDNMVINALSNIRGMMMHNGTRVNLVTHMINHILSQRPLADILYKVSVKVFKENQRLAKELFNICMISAIYNVINMQHRGNTLSPKLESKIIYGNLHGMQKNGNSLAQRMGNPKKIKSLSFVLLEAIRNNNIAKFYDIISKLYITNNMPIPEGIIDILNRSDAIRPYERAYAFLSGFNSGGKTDE